MVGCSRNDNMLGKTSGYGMIQPAQNLFNITWMACKKR